MDDTQRSKATRGRGAYDESRDLGNLGKRRNIVLWISDRLDVDGLGLLVDGRSKRLGFILRDPLRVDSEFLEQHCGEVQVDGFKLVRPLEQNRDKCKLDYL